MNFKNTVKTSTLPNGLMVVTDTIPNSKILYASVNVMTGGQHDPKDKLGLAHLSEHLAMHGVPDITGDELRDIFRDIGLKEHCLITSPYDTFYYGYGVTGDVNTWLGYISKAINHFDYNEAALDLELGRIVREMEAFYSQPEKVKIFSSLRSRFGSGQLAQVSGGVPEYFKNISLQDIRAHHEKSHVGSNMMFITSGEWAHERAVEWADENLGHLPKGAPYRKPNSSYQPQDIWLNDGLGGNSVDFEINFPTNFHHKENEYGGNLLVMSLRSKIDKLADSLGLYYIGLGVVDYPSEYAAVQLKSSCEPSKVKEVVASIVNLLEASCEKPDFKEFEKQKSLLKKGTTIYQDTELVNPEQRHDAMKFNYLINNDVLYPTLFEKQIDGADCEKAYEMLRDALSKKPGTFYYGAITNELLTGEMIKCRTFDQPIRNDNLIIRRFKPA